MANSHPAPADGAPRRIVLVDFDWHDADLVPELLRQPAISIGLVAGQGPGDPGVRLAEMCGVPHTVDLSDLTREIFDLALIGEHSARRAQLERVLAALGTPVQTVRGWLDPALSPAANSDGDAGGEFTDDASFLGGSLAIDASAALEAWLPDSCLPPATEPSIPEDRMRESGADAAAFDPGLPGSDDPDGLERTLEHWASSTEARAAEIHVRRAGEVDLVCRSGPEDPILDALVNLAFELGRPHVMNQLEGPERGKAWAAWPIRTAIRAGCVAAAAIDPVTGRAHWEHLVEDLRSTWDLEDREVVLRRGGADGAAYAGSARGRLELALERNRDEGLRYEAHRFTFVAPPTTVAAIAAEVAARVRETDFVRALAGNVLLLICSGPPPAFALIRRRVIAAWENAWAGSGETAPAPPFTDESVELTDSLDADRFHAVALSWIDAAVS